MSRFEEGCVFLLGAAFLLALFASTIQVLAVPNNRSRAQILPSRAANNGIDNTTNTTNSLQCFSWWRGKVSENNTELKNDELQTVLENPKQFKNKCKKLESDMKQISYRGSFFQYITRKDVFQDSYKRITDETSKKLRKRTMTVEFIGEKGIGIGLIREWFRLLTEEVFNPSRGLFKYVDENNNYYALEINPRSGETNGEHLEHFKFAGKFVGLAIFHKRKLNVGLIRPFYKMILKKKVEVEDLKDVDPQFYKSLVLTKESPEEMYLSFSVEVKTSDGGMRNHELKTGGNDISVTKNNVDEYIDLLINWTYVSNVKEQMAAFLEGLNHIVPLNLLTEFDANELELLLCGIRMIDVADWKKHTVYRGGYNKNSAIIKWFWEIIDEFDDNRRKKIFQFITGSYSIPIEGFKKWLLHPFQIEKKGASYDVPAANTCHRKFILPPYDTKERLKKELIDITETKLLKFNMK